MSARATWKFVCSCAACLLFFDVYAAEGPASLLAAVHAVNPGVSLFDFAMIQFRSGEPRRGEPLTLSLRSSSDLSSLEEAAEILRRYSKLRAQPVGYTDDRECRGVECDRLSMRRSKYVYDWLIAQGVPAKQLNAPEGKGGDKQVASNESEKGRQFNRRVELGDPYLDYFSRP
jgi:hypothetical protein